MCCSLRHLSTSSARALGNLLGSGLKVVPPLDRVNDQKDCLTFKRLCVCLAFFVGGMCIGRTRGIDSDVKKVELMVRYVAVGIPKCGKRVLNMCFNVSM